MPVLFQININWASDYRFDSKNYSAFVKEEEVIINDGMKYIIIDIQKIKHKDGFYFHIELDSFVIFRD